MTEHTFKQYSLVRDPKHAFVHMISLDEFGSGSGFDMTNEAHETWSHELDLITDLNIDYSRLSDILMSILNKRHGENFDQIVRNGDIVQLEFFDYRNSGTMIYHGSERKITTLDEEIDEYGSLPKNFTIRDFPVKYWEGRIVHNSIVNITPELRSALSKLDTSYVQKMNHSDFKSNVLDKVNHEIFFDITDDYIHYFIHFILDDKDYYLFADYYDGLSSPFEEYFIKYLQDETSGFNYVAQEGEIFIDVDNFIYTDYIDD